MAKDKQEQVSVRKIIENRRAEDTRREIAFIEKTGNMTVDVYNGLKPKTLGGKMPKMTADNEIFLIQHAVLNGYHDKPNGNCYVEAGAVLAAKTMKLRKGEEMNKSVQAYWDNGTGKDKSYFIDVVNAAQLEKFYPHNKLVPAAQLEEVIKALKEKALPKIEEGSTKDGKAWYDAAKDVAYIPKENGTSADRYRYMKDVIYMAASREVAKRNMEAFKKKNEGVTITFHNREVSKPEQLLLKHFVAYQLRMRVQLGADERNGLSRDSKDAVKDAVALLKRDEKMRSNIARRGAGIAYAMEQAYFKDIIKDKGKDNSKTDEKDKGKGLGD